MIINDNILNITWPNNIDLIITSPPYKDEDGYSDELIEKLSKLCYDNLNQNSLMFLNFGHLAKFKTRPFKVLLEFERAGFEVIDTITWVKNHYRPLQGNKRVNNLTEFIFMLAKGSPDIDRLSIGIPYEDKSNIKRWKGTNNKDLKCRGNVWNIKYETVNSKEEKLHNDRFPIELPEFCIKLSGISENSLVVDPFMGSGTTAIACLNLKMQYWGAELNPKNYEIITERIKKHEVHI